MPNCNCGCKYPPSQHYGGWNSGGFMPQGGGFSRGNPLGAWSSGGFMPQGGGFSGGNPLGAGSSGGFMSPQQNFGGISSGGFMQDTNYCCTYQLPDGSYRNICLDYMCPIATPTGLTLVGASASHCTPGSFECGPIIDTFY